MNAAEFAELLSRLRACREAVAWAKGKSLAEAWGTCQRGDWMLWLCEEMAGSKGWPTRQEIVLAACDCVERALKYVPTNEQPAKAIEVARAWAAGKASITEVRWAAAYDASRSKELAAMADIVRALQVPL